MRKRKIRGILIISLATALLLMYFCALPTIADTVINDMIIMPSQSAGATGLPKTGQTTSYDTGDDGDLQVGIARSYTYSDDGTIDTEAENVATDDATGLQWIRDHTKVTGSGSGAGGNVDISGTMTWATALSRCNSLSYNGQTDWRLPNAYELFSICEPENTTGAPYIDTAAFPNTYSNYYWSSTTYPSYTDYALFVYFSYGSVRYRYKTINFYVRAVRGGQ